MALELDSKYDHKKIESKWYKIWEEHHAFTPEQTLIDQKKRAERTEPYSIMIPPPNITGNLHVGHALNHTVQDVLIRTMRKRGKNTLWLPGTDHAGIATQSRVEKELKEKEKITRFDLGRDTFIQRVWDWKQHYGGVITSQIRSMGQSVDWSRERFTMDDGLSLAVRRVFVDLYKEGLIYRDTKMVNWDPVTRTVLSDLEVEYEEEYKGELWSFAYPLFDSDDEIVVATTRPETMLGDSAVAVHPDDPRYKKFIGKKVKHPLVDRLIPIIADAVLVDPKFGTGAVKVTPAHDPNDFEVGRRHNLEFINIFDESAHINKKEGGSFAGMDRFVARKAIKAKLTEMGLERGSKENMMSIGRSQRSGAIVEPVISTQWFVKIKPLAEPAIKAVEDGKIRFVPQQWTHTYFSWMREIRDWCISRQLWWGHQIPAWHCEECGHITVSMEDATSCEKCNSSKIHRDPDVLDTWFSSALWPFSTLGWPDTKGSDLQTWYPNSVLVTGFDIIFFWVARMIMMGLHFMKEPPFKDVYIHGLMRDEKGRKISKSLGNNIDPVDVVNGYGADAYRFFLMATLTEGKDSTYSEKRLKGYQNFANKVWNSSRFVLMNLPDNFTPSLQSLSDFKLEPEDLWILEELNESIAKIEKNIEEYKFHLAADEIYTLIWSHYCDWYIEFIKPRLYGKVSEESAVAARQTSFFVLTSLLGLLHPFMPFITEEIYSYLPIPNRKFLISAEWPVALPLSKGELKESSALKLLQQAIGAARTIRAEAGITPDKKIKLLIRTQDKNLKRVVEKKELSILRLAQAEEVKVSDTYHAKEGDAMEPFSEGEVYLSLKGVLDTEKEIGRLTLDSEKLSNQRASIHTRLQNSGFREHAPADVITKEEAKLAELDEKLKALQVTLARLKK